MKRSPQSSRKAFTLIEVMLAATIMLAGIVGAIQVLVSGSEMLETSRTQAVALQIIDSELAAVRMANLSGTWSASQPTALANGTSAISLATKYPASAYPNFQSVINLFTSCTRTVSFAQSRTDYKQVTITLTWQNHEGRSYTRTGTTYVGKNGLYVSYQR
jgi:type II secretory pathway pseudopilin PulG